MSQFTYTPIQLYYSATPGATPSASNLVNGELAINIADMKLFAKNSSNIVTLLASAAGALGDVAGPASATDNAVVRFDGTTGKLVKNSNVTIDNSGNLSALSFNGSGSGLTGTASGLSIGGNAATVTNGVYTSGSYADPSWITSLSGSKITGSISGTAGSANNLTGGGSNQIAYQVGSGSTAFITAPVSAGTVLAWNGSSFVWQSATSGSVTSVNVSGGTTGLTASGGPITSSGTITLGGTLITSNGGTGLSSYTAGDILFYSAGTALNRLGIGAAGSVLTSNGSSPQYTAQSSLSVGAATNISGGAANRIAYQTGAGSTGFVVAPTTPSTVLGWNGSSFAWVVVGTGSGDVVGPASSTDNAFARFDGTTGKLIQNSVASLADDGSANFAVSVGVAGNVTTAGEIRLFEVTTNGTNYISLRGPSSVASNLTFTWPSAYGSNGQVLTTDGTGGMSWQSVSGTGDVVGPASATDNAIVRFDTTTGKLIQNSNVTIDDTGNLQIGLANSLRLADADSSNYVAFKAPATVASNVTWTLPSADGSSGQFLSTDGSGNLAWTTSTGSGITVGKSIAMAMIFGF